MSRSRKHCQLSGGSTLKTTWSYLDNLGDRRLAEITNTGLSSGQYSNFQFATNVLDQISAVTETSDEATVYSAALSQSATYNDLNQLTDLSGQALTYDADGNLPSDGTRTYSWDAENRLVGIDYPAEPGKHTAFAYDGLGLRTTIVRTPTGGGNSVTTAYVWCGMRLCQVRDVTDAVILGSADLRQHGQRACLCLRSLRQPAAAHGTAHRLRLRRHAQGC